MDSATFAARRLARLERADTELRRDVEDALEAYLAGDSDWSAELLLAASQLWLEIFESESDGGNRSLALARFRRDLRESLAKTTKPDGEVSQAQIDRVTYWLSGYTVNSATTSGAFVRGVRFKKWVTMHDDDVRSIHTLADGQIVPISGTFDVGGHDLRYPGEPIGPPEVWINCRCVAQPAARDGEAMSGTTYVLGPEDEVEDENPDIVVGEKTALTAAGEYTSIVLVLVPAANDPIVAASSEDAHMTTVWMGEASAYSEAELKEILSQAQEVAAGATDLVKAVPESRGTLGDDEADVVFVRSDGAIDLREILLADDTPIRRAHDSVEQYPEWTQHLTLGYPETPAAGDYDADAHDEVVFDRIGVWIGGTHHDFQLGTGTEMAQDDDEEMVPDEPEEDEELITEIPVHGVLAPEGIPTGDGRMFAKGSLSTRPLPVPLRYETVGTHGGDTSMVVTVGRIDEAWRDEASEMWRFRGAVVLTRQYAQEVIDGIVDGTIRGVSIDGDDAEIETPDVEDDDGEGLFDALFNPGITTFTKMRVAGLTIVPIPAFHEAYIALGHEFTEDMSDAEVEEAFAALTACGCMQSDDVIDLSGDELANWTAAAQAEDGNFKDYDAEERKRMAEDGRALPDGSFPIADCDDLRNAIQAIGRASDPAAAKAHIRKRKSALGCEDVELPDSWGTVLNSDRMMKHLATGGIVQPGKMPLVGEQGPEYIVPKSTMQQVTTNAALAQFAPGTKDGPGWITHPVPTARIRRYWVRGEGAAKIRWGAPGDFNRCRMQLAKYVQNPDWLAGLCANMHYEALGFWPSQHAAHRAEQHRALVASGARVAPIARLVAAPVLTEEFKHEWFENPGLSTAEPLTIEGNRIFGYIAEWGSCHVGIAGVCEEVPRSLSDYGFFRKGIVETDQGPVAVGCITYGVGHPSEYVRAEVATAHYDRTDAIRAFVNVGEDAHGIWFAGVLAPWVTEADIAAMRAIGSLSGDWRLFAYGGELELIAAVVVPVPGFQLRRSLVASGRQTALIAAGRVPAKGPAPARNQFGSNVVMDPEMVAAIARTAVDEYRHAEKVEARATPAREKVRAHRLAAARERVKGA